MHIEELRSYCISKKLVTENFPFDNDILVFKVCGKMFALISLKKPDTVNLKCDPEKALELRERYDDVQPGYHMSKIHWNTVALKGAYTDKELAQWIDHSYDLVVRSLTKKEKLLFL